MDEYTKLIDELELELRKSIGEIPSLAKSEEESEEKKDEQKEGESKDAESKEEPKAEESKEDQDMSEEDMEELHKMYASMGKKEHEAHIKALKKAMAKCWKAEDMEKCWKSEEESKEEAKEEDKKDDEKKEGEEMEKCGDVMTKSEPVEVESLKKQNEELKKNLEGLVAAMTTFVTKAPPRKAITDVSIIKKSEEVEAPKALSKSEITKILNKKAQDPSLSKSDREAINAFCYNQVGLDAIKHLLG